MFSTEFSNFVFFDGLFYTAATESRIGQLLWSILMRSSPSKPTMSSLAKSCHVQVADPFQMVGQALQRFLKSRPCPERQCGAVSNAWQDIYVGALSLANSEVSLSKWLSLQRISTSSSKGAIQPAIFC